MHIEFDNTSAVSCRVVVVLKSRLEEQKAEPVYAQVHVERGDWREARSERFLRAHDALPFRPEPRVHRVLHEPRQLSEICLSNVCDGGPGLSQDVGAVVVAESHVSLHRHLIRQKNAQFIELH